MSDYRDRTSQCQSVHSRVALHDIREAYPAGKREFDGRAIWLAWVARPLSFYVAWPLARWGVSANAVTYVSIISLLAGCVLLVQGQRTPTLVGAFLVNVWFLLDCVDGNLARYYSKKSGGSARRDSWYGKFIDDLGAILFRGSLFVSVGIGFYRYPEGRLIQLFSELWSPACLLARPTTFMMLGSASAILLLMSLAVHRTYLEATNISGLDTFSIANPRLMSGATRHLVRIFWNLIREPNVSPLLFIAVVLRVVDGFLVYYSVAYFALFVLTVSLYVRKR